MRERGEGRAGWKEEWDEGQKRGQGWMDVKVGREKEKRAGLDGWGSGKKVRGWAGVEWMREWGE